MYFDELEGDIQEELAAVIGDLADKKTSRLSDCKPSENVIQAMATAATQVLIAFEHGYQKIDGLSVSK